MLLLGSFFGDPAEVDLSAPSRSNIPSMRAILGRHSSSLSTKPKKTTALGDVEFLKDDAVCVVGL